MSGALQKLRIIAIPLTRPKNASQSHPLKPSRLVYYQFQLTISSQTLELKSTRLANGDQQESETASLTKRSWLPEEGIVKWTTNKATDIWSGFGKTKSGWKPKVYRAGERMVDRMEFEELALKSIDLSRSPSAVQFASNLVPEDKKSVSTISLVFPPSFLSPSEVLSELRGYVEHWIPKHRNGFYLWMLIAPITAPFMIIPIIPNLPFFFCVWRSWSHYRAYRSSQYLQSLLDHDVIVPEECKSLDAVYNLHPPTTPTSPSNSDPVSESEPSMPKPNPEQLPQHTILLGPEAIPAIISLFELKSTTNTDLRRAVEQARFRVSSGRINV